MKMELVELTEEFLQRFLGGRAKGLSPIGPPLETEYIEDITYREGCIEIGSIISEEEAASICAALRRYRPELFEGEVLLKRRRMQGMIVETMDPDIELFPDGSLKVQLVEGGQGWLFPPVIH